MTENARDEWQNVRLIIRVHVREISPLDVLDVQAGINRAVANIPDAEVEVTQLPLLPDR